MRIAQSAAITVNASSKFYARMQTDGVPQDGWMGLTEYQVRGVVEALQLREPLGTS